MKRSLLLASVLAAVAVALAACNKSSETVAPGAASDTPAASDTAASASGASQ